MTDPGGPADRVSTRAQRQASPPTSRPGGQAAAERPKASGGARRCAEGSSSWWPGRRRGGLGLPDPTRPTRSRQHPRDGQERHDDPQAASTTRPYASRRPGGCPPARRRLPATPGQHPPVHEARPGDDHRHDQDLHGHREDDGRHLRDHARREGRPRRASTASSSSPSKNFFHCVIFHRVIPGFVDQTGDPTGTGTGGPGYQFPTRPARRRTATRRSRDGQLRREPPTASQFFVVAAATTTPKTNGSQYSVFVVRRIPGRGPAPPTTSCSGRSTSGPSVVAAITKDGLDRAGPAEGHPAHPLRHHRRVLGATMPDHELPRRGRFEPQAPEVRRRATDGHRPGEALHGRP